MPNWDVIFHAATDEIVVTVPLKGLESCRVTVVSTLVDSFPSDPHDSVWGMPPWPDKFTAFRDHQATAITEIVDAFDAGVDVIIMDAPTGSGKSVLAEGVRRLLGVNKALYVCHTKALQNQFASDFTYGKVLKGRSNYLTLNDPTRLDLMGNPITAGDCTKVRDESTGGMRCSYCNPWVKCPYEMAKFAALRSPLAILNTSYFITEANGPGGFSKRPFVIVDECDTLESIMGGHVTLEVTGQRLKKMGIAPPSKKTVEESWGEWVEEVALPSAAVWMRKYEALVKREVASVEERREWKFYNGLVDKLGLLMGLLADGNALYDGYKEGDVRFKPVRVNRLAPKLLWPHAQKWLLMSATVIDPTEFVESLGIEEAGLDWRLVSVPSTFPAINRPIVIKNAVSMRHQDKETAWPLMLRWVIEVLKLHPEHRTLVHSVSYAFTEYLVKGVREWMGKEPSQGKRSVITHKTAREKDAALKAYLARPGSIMISPSMDRGVDLPEEACRVQVVCKVPFPNLGDKVVQRRAYGKGGEKWYAIQTIRTLVQMTGRGVRSENDQCWTYIIDAQFHKNLYAKNKFLMPGYWREAFDMTGGGLPLTLPKEGDDVVRAVIQPRVLVSSLPASSIPQSTTTTAQPPTLATTSSWPAPRRRTS